jgi:hypothetical protein
MRWPLLRIKRKLKATTPSLLITQLLPKGNMGNGDHVFIEGARLSEREK